MEYVPDYMFRKLFDFFLLLTYTLNILEDNQDVRIEPE